jgi:hypothetical protein
MVTLVILARLKKFDRTLEEKSWLKRYPGKNIN